MLPDAMEPSKTMATKVAHTSPTSVLIRPVSWIRTTAAIIGWSFVVLAVLTIAGAGGLWWFWRSRTGDAVRAIPGLSSPIAKRLWQITVGLSFLAIIADTVVGHTLLAGLPGWSLLVATARPLLIVYVFGIPGVLIYNAWIA